MLSFKDIPATFWSIAKPPSVRETEVAPFEKPKASAPIRSEGKVWAAAPVPKQRTIAANKYLILIFISL